ncbi:hypothetical protein TUM12370_20320 [Salmonella enterica subsp. enterica serovar Choleraesuis]|nr:hypothetical protein TUM12370_20320 [Salmonella enterica subsp. enterica serovar Choleraesuis]
MTAGLVQKKTKTVACMFFRTLNLANQTVFTILISHINLIWQNECSLFAIDALTPEIHSTLCRASQQIIP